MKVSVRVLPVAASTAAVFSFATGAHSHSVRNVIVATAVAPCGSSAVTVPTVSTGFGGFGSSRSSSHSSFALKYSRPWVRSQLVLSAS